MTSAAALCGLYLWAKMVADVFGTLACIELYSYAASNNREIRKESSGGDLTPEVIMKMHNVFTLVVSPVDAGWPPNSRLMWSIVFLEWLQQKDPQL